MAFFLIIAIFMVYFFENEGSVTGRWVKAVQPVQFRRGFNDLTLLSQTVGLQVNGLVFWLLIHD